MRICFLGNGNSVHIKRWLEFFKNQGHDVYIITFSNADISGITIHNVGPFNIDSNGGNWQYVRKVTEVKKLIGEINPDIVNAHYITSYGFIGALSGFKPLVLSAWGTDILVTPRKNIAYKMITKYALNKSDLITSDSNYMTGEINNLTKTRTITVPMGVEKELCYINRIENSDEIKILSLRTIDKNSNINIVLKAFSLLVKKHKYKTAKLIITNDGPEIDNIKKLVIQEKIEENVEIKGFIERKDLLNLLLSSNICISIPTSDSTSVTLLEAMACGITNIVSDIPANSEWIKDGFNGIIVKDKKVENVAAAMENAINNELLKQNSIKINREIIMQRAIWDDNMKFVENEYCELIKNF